MFKEIAFYGSLIVLAVATHVVTLRALAQTPYDPGDSYVPCPSTGFIAGIGYIPEDFVCRCTVTVACGQGTMGTGCAHFILQAMWAKDQDGVWQVIASDRQEPIPLLCQTDEDLEVQMFTFDLASAVPGAPQPVGQRYYSVGLWKGSPSDPFDPVNLLDAAGIYFTLR